MSDFLVEESIKQYPKVYARMKDIQQISKAEDIEYKKINSELIRLDNDIFFDTASEQMVERKEKIAGITSNPNIESLEFRRTRVQNRFNMSAPYTVRFLIDKLNEIIGEGKWKATLNETRTRLVVQCSADTQAWMEEIEATILDIIPITIKFINSPYTKNMLLVNNSTESGVVNYNYKLGTWQLGIDAIGTVKMKEIVGVDKMTLEANYLSTLTKEMIESISRVVLNNGDIEITDITTKVEGCSGKLMYYIDSSLAENITNIQLVREDGEVITNAAVYIPLTSDVQMQHNFEVREG